jgi:hypothetical protein
VFNDLLSNKSCPDLVYNNNVNDIWHGFVFRGFDRESFGNFFEEGRNRGLDLAFRGARLANM